MAVFRASAVNGFGGYPAGVIVFTGDGGIIVLRLHQAAQRVIAEGGGAENAVAVTLRHLLGNPSVRDRLAINHSKMLAYAGILATPGRSPDVVSNLVSHCFDLADVSIENWQLRKVAVEPAQQNRLGVRNPKRKTAGYVPGRSVIGVNFTLGARVPDRSGKFLLRIGNLTMARYLSFLPEGENHQALIMFVSFLLRDQFAWDLQLSLAPDQAKGMRLGDRSRSCIGRTAFIGLPKAPPSVTLHIRD